MGAPCDFRIKYDPGEDNSETITKKIMYSVFIKRLKYDKPAVCFIDADSGEGKSYSMIGFQELLMNIQGLNLKDNIDAFKAMNICNPLEYPDKLNSILYDKKLKKFNILSVHDARELVPAQSYQSFVSTAIPSVNALSRKIKPLCIFILSQFFGDVTRSIRNTVNYYIEISRPLGKKPRLRIFVMWKDRRDPENCRLKKRRLMGYLVYPDGRHRQFIPQYLEFGMPSKELINVFDEMDLNAKKSILGTKMKRILSEMRDNIGIVSDKVVSMVEFYSDNPEQLSNIGKRYRGKWKIKKEIKVMHDLTDVEKNKFEELLNEKIKDKGLVADE